MKVLILTLTLFLFASHTHQTSSPYKPPERPSAIDPIRLAYENRLHSDMREYGLKELARKALVSHGVEFPVDPVHRIYSVRTDNGGTLEVTYEADIKDVNGKDHTVIFTVASQVWHNWIGLKSYSLVDE